MEYRSCEYFNNFLPSLINQKYRDTSLNNNKIVYKTFSIFNMKS